MQPLRNTKVQSHIARLADSYRDLLRKQILDRCALQNRTARKVTLPLSHKGRNEHQSGHTELSFHPIHRSKPMRS